MLVFKAHGTLLQVSFCGHHDLVKKLLLVMIIELLDDSIAPRFGLRNKPWLHSMVQTQPNQRSHATGIPRASPKAHFVVHLKVTGYAHTYPDGPKPINNALARSCGQRLYGTAPSHDVH